VTSKSVLLVEDDVLYRDAVAAALRKAKYEVTVVQTARDIAKPALLKRIPSITGALVDLRLQPDSGVDVIAYLRAAGPHLCIAALTAHSTDEDLFGALAAGADGYLLKSDAIANLPKQVDALLKGLAPLSPGIARRLIKHFTEPSTLATEAALSPRELELLQLLAGGFTFFDCAASMNITQETVRTMVKRVRQKLHADSVTEAVSVGFRAGILR
jgi:DNA-binding NarL/FixJ family response regulator